LFRLNDLARLNDTSSRTRSKRVCKPPRADILDAGIHLGGEPRKLIDGIIREIERHLFGAPSGPYIA
jgi:hypothetical protein